jgi:ABC-type multidrug transport system ATPase subunit
MKETIAARAREGTAVILSSHLLHLVEELCTRLLVIRKGERVAYGTVARSWTSAPSWRGGRSRSSSSRSPHDAFRSRTTPHVSSAPALWYLARLTARNRLRTQLARLRQPRYVIAMLLGGSICTGRSA